MKWISIKKRLPELHDDVFVMNKYGDVDYMFLQIEDFKDTNSNKYWLHPIDVCNDCIEKYSFDYVMYWMPITELPALTEQDKKQQRLNRIRDSGCPDGKLGCLVAHSDKSVQEAIDKIG